MELVQPSESIKISQFTGPARDQATEAYLEMTPIREDMATTEANNEQQAMTTQWIYVYENRKVSMEKLQEYLEVELEVEDLEEDFSDDLQEDLEEDLEEDLKEDFSDDLQEDLQDDLQEYWQEDLTEISPEIAANRKQQILNILWKPLIILFQMCNSVLLGFALLLIILAIWAYSYGDPMERLQSAMKELTKNRAVASGNWMQYF